MKTTIDIDERETGTVIAERWDTIVGMSYGEQMPVRVVIAEDEWLIAATLRRQVESHGFEVIGTAGTGTRVVELCGEEHPDLVLMDVQMPEMDGIQATKEIMQKDPTCVVIVTGKGQMLSAAEEAGAMSYVVKPLLSNQIPQVVESARQRFEHFITVQKENGGAQQVLHNWLQVQDAVKILMVRDNLSEEAAFQRLRQMAANDSRSLLKAAESILAEISERVKE